MGLQRRRPTRLHSSFFSFGLLIRTAFFLNILLLGDVVGRAGREAVNAHLPGLKRDLAVDTAIVNAENAAHGFGLTEKICGELYEAGADTLTTGNHVWDQRELITYIARDDRVLRPANFPDGTPGEGWRLHRLADGRTVLVINLMGRLFMDALDDPFAKLGALLERFPLGAGADAIVVDLHGEATVCGAFVQIDGATGLARRIEPVRVGGRLTPYLPRL